MIRFILAALAAVLAVPAAAQAPVQAPSASYSAAKTPKVVSAAPMRLEGAVQAHRIELARPGATERAKLASLNGNRGTALSSPGMPQFIGFGRDVDAQKRRVDLSALTWTTTADGARVARIEVASLGAAGIRVAVRMPTTHPDVQVRFAGGTASAMTTSQPPLQSSSGRA